MSESGEATVQTTTVDERRAAERGQALSESGEATVRTTTVDERRAAERGQALSEALTMAEVQTPAEQQSRPPSRVLDVVIQVAGVVIAVLAALLSGLLEIFLSPLRAGGVPLGVSILIAAVGNFAIGWFAHATAGKRWAVALPWAVWTLLMLFAAGTRTTEGDYLISGDNWMALVMILVGSLAYAVFAYRMILKPLPTAPAEPRS